MRVQPVVGERALLLEEERIADALNAHPRGERRRVLAESATWDFTPPPRGAVTRADHVLVIGDVHVGLEAHFAKSGVRLPSQTHAMRARLDTLVKDSGAGHLIVIGDLKHAIPVSSFQETRELAGFFTGLDAGVTLVRGNHDVDLHPMDNARVHDAWSMRVGDALLLHGHAWPDPEHVPGARFIIMCHNHPMVLLVDELGRRHKEPCWVRARFTDAARDKFPGLDPDARLIVLPAFNDLLGGAAFNGPEGRGLLGPFFANDLVDVDAAHLHTLDGIDLGTVKDLREYAKDPPNAPRERGRARRGGG